MFIFDERDKILGKAFKALLSRNVPKIVFNKIEKNNVGLLPRKSNGQYLPEISAWLKVREEDVLYSEKPYLFFDPVSGWRIDSAELKRVFPNVASFRIDQPPQELFDALKVLQFYCGLKYKAIVNLDIQDYSIATRTLTIRNYSKNDHKYFLGSPEVIRFRDNSMIKLRLPKNLGDILKAWVYYRGQLPGSFLWTASFVYGNHTLTGFDSYSNWLFSLFETPENFIPLLEAASILGCHWDTIYKRLRKNTSKHPALLYRNSILLSTQEMAGFPKFFGEF